MSRRWLLSLLCLSATLIFVQFSSANSTLLVNESATRFLIQDQTTVVLEAVNPTKQDLLVRLKLDLLDPKDNSRGFAVRQLTLRPGLNKLSIPLTLLAGSVTDDEALPWYRVSYRIEPIGGFKLAPDAAHGVISLSQIDTPDIFALEVSAPRRSQRGARHATHIRTFNPITAKPVKGVNVTVELKFDDAAGQTVTGAGVTDDDGYLLVNTAIPVKLHASEGEVKVVAKHGSYVKEVSDDLELNGASRIMITTDKPIYQPGQPLHVRVLVFDSSKRAAANASATLKLVDPENTTVFQTDLLTSRFGVASADWPIPENTRLGDYGIHVEMDDENYDDSGGFQQVKISRYDLPNFAVSAKPDRFYYLPGQNAEVEVRANYLFGQPVKRGHVRVVREEDRRWDFLKQEWEIKADETHEGETDDEGRFVARLDLTKDHDQLATQHYSRFTDLHYAAYFTDPTTNRTEQRRFDLRVTKDAIHVYIAEEGYRQQAAGFPLRFYVATSYADGMPASCEVAIRRSEEDGEQAHQNSPILKTIRTNKYGLGKVTDLVLPKEDDSSPDLSFTASGSFGQAGHHDESFYYRDSPVVRVETDRALYRAGDPIKVSITASQPELNLIVDVRNESHIVESRHVSMQNGKATIMLRYRPEFKSDVTISAYARVSDASDDDLPFAARTVLFPRDSDLKLNFRLDQADYKPGEDATVDFHVSTADGRSANSALGVVIFDRAVEERARTDEEFGGSFGFSGSFRQWRGYDNQIGGISLKELRNIDLKKPVPEEISLVAELLLGTSMPWPKFFEGEDFEKDHVSVFAGLTSLQVKPVGELLATRYKNGGIHPTNGTSLRRLLFEGGRDFNELRDPWGMPFREAFSIRRDSHVLDIMSAGPDKQFATGDDFSVSEISTPYFRFTGEAINRAVENFHARTGGFVRDAATLKTELQSEGINFELLRDPWGQPYQLSFTARQNHFNVIVTSSGPNKRFDPGADQESDDFTIWIASIDYLRETRPRLEKALRELVTQSNSLTNDNRGLDRVLGSVEPDKLQDPWGSRYYPVYKTTAYSVNRHVIQSFAVYGQPEKARMDVTPVVQQISSILLRSNGPDREKGTADDFNVASFSGVLGESVENTPERIDQTFLPGPKGAIKGTITDAAEGAIASAKVQAKLQNSSLEFETETDDAGRFFFQNLPAGYYTLRCDASNFKIAVISEVPVSSSKVTTINFKLEPGNISETVTVSAGASLDNASSSAISTNITEGRMQISIGQPQQLATPRLRDYFPETLVWQPSLETNHQGRAQLKFKLADNITTWKMSVIGSTEDGEIGIAEADIKAFQPFFVEHDPPRVLTEGDQISLPVVLRNYLERPQTVELEMKPESWFTLRGPARQSTNVLAGDAARPVFELQAVASVKDGKQRITARGQEASDAIEKPVTVHPDGEERTQTVSDFLGDSHDLDFNLPASTIPGSMQAELKLYASPMAHVMESVEGILERPHGCGEQTISSTYPSLLVLRHHKRMAIDSPVTKKAQRYVVFGYQRLLNYRSEDGGFSYWGRGDSDLALTAYALRFLQEAADFVAVDRKIIEDARRWLIRQQHANGSWSSDDSPSRHERNEAQTALLTAFVTRVLGMTASQLPTETDQVTLKRALSYLALRVDEIKEPYLIASYALAASSAGDRRSANWAVEKLRALVQREGSLAFWSIEASTPFNGWGLAGRVETTALALQALTRSANTATPEISDPLVRSGLLFLLKQKDGYGVWYSTQATINVLDTLISLTDSDAAAGNRKSRSSPIEISVNGQPATSLTLAAGDQYGGLLRADISRFIHSGVNHVEVRRAGKTGMASVQLVARYYVPWSQPDAKGSGAIAGEESSLRLAATFDKTSAVVNEAIVCHVKAERRNRRGDGMLLAELGLPPGAEVDRASLETARKNSGSVFSQYDILPDRVVVYLWPHSGGVSFDFKFRPRFAMTAKTAPSVVYDYYNPEARAVVEPVRFVVR